MSVASDGIQKFIAEVTMRGGKAEQLKIGRMNVVQVSSSTGRKFRVRIRTKTSGDWQGTKADSSREHDKSKADFWAFVDMRPQSGETFIVPAQWMADDIKEQVEEWQAEDDTRDPKVSVHHAIRSERIAEWRGCWDLLDLSGGEGRAPA